MKNQSKLFDVPKDRPSRQKRLNAFKAEHGIETHYCPGVPGPWSACHMPTARKIGDGYGKKIENIGDAVAHLCRLLEEQGILVTGNSEREAITELCRNGVLPLPP